MVAFVGCITAVYNQQLQQSRTPHNHPDQQLTVTVTRASLDSIHFPYFTKKTELSDHNPKDVVDENIKNRRRVGGLPRPDALSSGPSINQ